jgi:hypothetical protein
LVGRIDLAFLATAQGEFTAKGINRSLVSTIVNPPFPGNDEGLPGNGRAGLRYGRRMPPGITCQPAYYAGLRWSRTYSSVPVPGPLFVPEGWQLWYGLAWVGQPV